MLYAQDLLDDASADITVGQTQGIFSETVNIISRSGKIFILSNSNQLLGRGDFITLSLKGNGPVARAVVAKNIEGQVGIKILKVYSLSRWNMISKGLAVDILKGDDSSLFVVKKSKEEQDIAESKIESAEDLYNDKSLVDEDLSDFYKDNRIIKPDNIVTAAYNQLTFKEEFAGETVGGNQFSFAWAYQFSDNYWAEALFGRTSIDDYPSAGTQTLITNFTGRLKYSIQAPLYSYIFPYIGFQTFSVSSPNAGVVEGSTTELEADAELETIDKLKKTNLVIGVTVLRRLVPGWFLKADLGTDILSLGFGIEF
jgi:hypothetical protein